MVAAVRVDCEPLRCERRAPLWSAAALLYALIVVAQWVAPFFIAFATPSFWVKEGVYFEQPDVRFKRAFVVHAILSDGSQRVWSTVPSVAHLVSRQTIPSLQTTASDIDDDADDIADRLHVKLTVPSLGGSLSVSVVRVLLLFQATFSARARVAMEADVWLEQSVPSARAKTLRVFGQLGLRQREPFPLGVVRTACNTSIVPADATALDDVLFPAILRRSAERSESLEVWPVRTVWDYAPTPAATLAIDVELRSPVQRVVYRPAFAETLKHAWVQYLAVWWIVWAALRIVRAGLFRHTRLFATWQRVEPSIAGKLKAN